MNPENIKKLIKEWKKELGETKKQLKRFVKEECHLTAAVIDIEASVLSKCLRELEEAVRK